MKRKFNAKNYIEYIQNVQDVQDCIKVPMPQIREDQNYIFISYSHQDFREVYTVLANLYEAGVRFWYDKGLRAGKDWEHEVKSMMESKRCVGVIFFLSGNLFKSESANKEIAFAYRGTGEDGGKPGKNYFSVNLTRQRPFDILMSVMRSEQNTMLNMEHVSILSSAFSDKATYIHYGAPDYINDLVAQIKSQFGVVDDMTEEAEMFAVDSAPCDIFIGSVEIMRDERIELAKELTTYFEEDGYRSYLMQTAENVVLKDSIGISLEEYCEQQNREKIKKCRYLLLFSSFLGWHHLAGYFENQSQEVDGRKKVIYLIDDKNHGQSYFIDFYHLDPEREETKELLKRVLFLDDYKEKLEKMIRKGL